MRTPRDVATSVSFLEQEKNHRCFGWRSWFWKVYSICFVAETVQRAESGATEDRPTGMSMSTVSTEGGLLPTVQR